MTKRKPVLVLFIITALVLIAGAVLFAVPTMFMNVPELKVTFLELNQGIMTALTGKNMVANVLSIALTAVLFVIIPLFVHIARKQHSVTIVLLLGALVALYVDLLLVSYTEIKASLLEQLTKDQAAAQELISKGFLFILGVGLIALSSVLEFVTFIVDMCIRVKKNPEAVPTVQNAREEEKAEEPAPAEEPAQVVAAPVEEPVEEKVEEPAPEEEPEEAEEELEEEPAEEKVEEEAPAKEEKKPEPKRATQTIKKAEILTNEEGKSFAKAYHISQRKELNKWQVKGAGSEKALKLFDTQKEAIEYANQLSANNGAAVRVHSRAGKMRKA